MDQREKTIDFIRKYCIAKEQNERSAMIKSVCSCFDVMKDQELSQGDWDFLRDCSSVVGVPQYIDLLEKEVSVKQDRNISLATLASLLNKANLTRNGVVLHKYQKEVIDRFVCGQCNRFILSAPTSFGKTFIAYEIIKMMKYANAVMIFPTISLLSENFERLISYPKGSVFCDYRIHSLSEDDVVGDKNIWIFTPERFLSFIDKHQNFRFDFIFIDEIYKIDNEFIIDKELSGENERDIAYRVALSCACDKSCDLLLAGPYMDMTDKRSFANFVKDNNFSIINYNEIEIVNKTIADIKGKKRYEIEGINVELKGGSKFSKVCDIAEALTSSNENTIIYNNFKHGVERYAREIINILLQKGMSFCSEDVVYNMFIQHLESTYSSEWIVVRALKFGIGVHHGLVPKYIQKEIINLFNKGILLYLVSTTTITEGVNTSAKNIIITSDKKGRKALKPFDAKNIAGRAGRFLRHFSGRVIVVSNNFKEIWMSNQDGLNHKNYDVDSKKSDVDYTITADKYLTKEDSENKKLMLKEVKDRNIPSEIIEQYKTICISDKIKIYDNIQVLNEVQFNRIKSLIANLKIKKQITWEGFQEIINILKPIIKDKSLLSLVEKKCKSNNDIQGVQCSVITAQVYYYLRGGFFEMLNFYNKRMNYNEAMRRVAYMIYNVFKYQLVKYLGVFNLMYQYILSRDSGKALDEIPGITILLQKLEHNAYSTTALILSDYGVPFKLIDYYDDENVKKNKDTFDSYEQYIDTKISRIISH